MLKYKYLRKIIFFIILIIFMNKINCNQCKYCRKSKKSSLFCTHPIIIQNGIPYEIDSIDELAVEHPKWCPLEQDNQDSVKNTQPAERNIENFIIDIRNGLQQMMIDITDSDPNNILKCNIDMKLTDKNKKDAVKFADDLLHNKIYPHYNFIMVEDNKSPNLAVFEVFPRHPLALSMLSMCFPDNTKEY